MYGQLLKGSILLGTAALLPLPANATLDCTISVDGVSIGTCVTSNTGSISFDGADAPLFSSITLTGDGVPVLTTPDLSTVTLDVSDSATFTGTHVLDVLISQTGISAPAGTTLQSTATVNNLIGTTPAGPSTLSDFVNGAVLRSSTFPAEFTGTVGPFVDTIGTAITSDAHEYSITFTSPGQSANDTIQLEGIVPGIAEPGSLGLLGAGLIGTGFAIRRKRS